MEMLLIFFCGLVVSSFGTVVGFGGGVFIIPLLVVVFKIPMHIAVGSVIFALFPSALISTIINYKQGNVDFVLGIMWEVPATAGVVSGAFMSSKIPDIGLRLIFGIIVLSFGLILVFQEGMRIYAFNNVVTGYFKRFPAPMHRNKNNNTYTFSRVALSGFSIFTGFIAGLLGVGGGFLKTPILVSFFGIPARIATATSLFTIATTSITGSVSHYFLGHFRSDLALILAISFATGAMFGNKIFISTSDKVIKILVAAGLFLSGLSMFVFSFWI